MMSQATSKPYVIDYDEEPRRLEKQARVAKIEDHLRKFSFPPEASILEAGCGSGAMARLLANHAPQGHVTGIDKNERYLEFARRRAREEGIDNITFRHGDIFDLPFEDDTFDLVWCKYVLQWVNDPIHAVRQFKRVTRSGGAVVSCHFDGFGVTHYPVDTSWQSDAEKFSPFTWIMWREPSISPT